MGTLLFADSAELLCIFNSSTLDLVLRKSVVDVGSQNSWGLKWLVEFLAHKRHILTFNCLDSSYPVNFGEQPILNKSEVSDLRLHSSPTLISSEHTGIQFPKAYWTETHTTSFTRQQVKHL